jgi:hypothetical protein
MRVYVSEETTTVGQAPAGLLLLFDGELIVKTEYRRGDRECECYIVASGEAFHGEGDKARCKPVVVR